MHAQSAPLPPRDALLDILDRFPGAPITLIGDLVLDRHQLTRTERISREAPVLIVQHEHDAQVPGGAANVACNLQALGADLTLLGLVGDDPAGHALLSCLRAHGLDTAHLVVDDGFETPTKTRILASDRHTPPQQVLRVDRGGHAPPHRIEPLTAAIAALPPESVLLVSDYGLGTLSPPVIDAVTARARQAPVVLDSRAQLTAFRAAALLTPNEGELEHALHTPVTDETVVDLALALREQTDSECVLVTRGNRGMVLCAADAEPLALDVVGSAHAMDITGAGDTVVSVMALGLAVGAPWLETTWLANCAAGRIVMQRGAAAIRGEELRDALSQLFPAALSRSATTTQVVSLTQAQAAVAPLRARGARIVFANGCFDLLHVGHIRYLQAAKALGEVLVVGVNDDASVRQLKGPGRPLVPAAERAELVAALEVVDCVVIFSGDSPTEVISAVRPDIHAKGTDFTVDTVPERALVESLGGRVAIVGDPKEHATSELMARARERLDHVGVRHAG